MLTFPLVRSAKLALAALASIALVGLAACDKKESASIKIGHYASLTGSEATFGVSTDNGIKLAVEEQNAAGGVKGKKVELITYDNQGKPQESVTAVTRLIQHDTVVAVLGEVASSRSLAVGPVCQ